MGRWAFFNTGIEYKFAFATQSSADITMFSGQDDGHHDGYYYWSWSACCDAERCLRTLRRMERDYGWDALDFDRWSKDVAGSEQLLSEIYHLVSGDPEAKFRYILGCLIYHQLLWCRELSCHYEA